MSVIVNEPVLRNLNRIRSIIRVVLHTMYSSVDEIEMNRMVVYIFNVDSLTLELHAPHVTTNRNSCTN